MTLRERIIIVFVNDKTRRFDVSQHHYPVRLSTSTIDRMLGNSHTNAEIRKELISLEKDGYLHKDLNYSRRGNAVWRWGK